MANRDYAPDEWSDHDFFLISHPGVQEELRSDLSWLPFSDRIALSFRETDHGLKVIYDDGHMLEFAVFDLGEVVAFGGVNRHRVLLDRGGVAEAVATAAAKPPRQRDDLHCFGMVVSAALVAGGRGRRGEAMSAAFLVTWGMTYLARLIQRHVPAENASLLDEFDALRRFERVYPELGAELAAICRLAPAEGGPALLDVMDRELRGACPDLPWAGLDAVRARLRSAS